MSEQQAGIIIGTYIGMMATCFFWFVLLLIEDAREPV